MKTQCVADWEQLTQSEVVIVPAWDSQCPECCARLAGRIGGTAQRLAKMLEGAPANDLLVYLPHGKFAVKLLGIGPKLHAGALRNRVRQWLSASPRRPQSVGIDLEFAAQGPSNEALRLVQAAVEGCLLGDYDPGSLHKTTKSERGLRPEERGRVQLLRLLVPAGLKTSAGRRARRAEAIAAAQREILDLVNQPGNVITPQQLAEAAKKSGQRDGYRVRILDKKAIHKAGMEALLAVNQGSSLPPVLIVLEYRPGKVLKGAPKIGLVGKGITFDTGGISIKSRQNMHWMKSDMAGAAAVIGTVGAAARNRLPIHVVGVIPSTDNKPDGAALSPGDVIGSLAGATIEVEDTDAEGRLILADGLAYLKKHFAPDVMIDLATLTGACIVALGDKAAGLFCENEALACALTEAGERTDERLWRLPLWPEYDRQLESDVADIKNFGGAGAGAVTAARFLHRFTGDHPAWAHLDIAGVAYPEAEGNRFRTASGFGVRLLTEYLIGLAETA